MFFDWRKSWDPPSWPEGSRTTQPPLCDQHAVTAFEECWNSSHFTALRVKCLKLWGVIGAHHQYISDGWRVSQEEVMYPYGDPSHSYQRERDMRPAS
ncbi:hypothetical protein FHS42_006009 [Streptomyces zagrosensis]|uniref:Uncharacterized protein n=1 Tax=Streptomyces zagrosensis TaxID=1042984 RepID=A0A7W9QEQ3_9ACTN|nr:hypothetical protein [Streptomyces zagrosensis]